MTLALGREVRLVDMLCGHNSRWVYTDEDLHGPGTSYCVMCLLEDVQKELARLRGMVNIWQRRDEAAKGNNAANATEMQNYLREEVEQTSTKAV
jgi:hypothetical protein